MQPDPTNSDTADAFITRWRAAGGSERANYQLFIGELCALLGLPAPEPARDDQRDNAYARGDVTTNTVESSFSLLKRGLVGTSHSVSEQHLQRYATEFDFRWNYRIETGYNDVERAAVALKNISGKRLTYRRIDA